MNAQMPLPLARATDPDTSTEAAQFLSPGNDHLIRAIRHVVRVYGPCTQDLIADEVQGTYGNRWKRGTIISACARSGLTRYEHDELVCEPGRKTRRYSTWYLKTENTNPL